MPEISKELMTRRFLRSIKSYDNAATVQLSMAGQLVDLLLARHSEDSFGSILEIGCGTGGLTKRLKQRLRFSHLTLSDIVPECRACHDLSGNTDFVPGDIEKLTFARQFDLVISNAVFQWIKDLGGLLRKFSGMIVPGGSLAFSTFGPDNLFEIRALTGRGLSYPSVAEINALVAAAGFTVEQQAERRIELEFADPLDVLTHLKATGVTATGKPVRWTRSQVLQFSSEYGKRYRNRSGRCTLTYSPVWIVAAKIGGR